VATRQRSSTELLELIDYREFPDDVRETIVVLGSAIVDGFDSIADLKRVTGLSDVAVRAQLAAVKAAFVEQARSRAEGLDEQLRALLDYPPRGGGPLRAASRSGPSSGVLRSHSSSRSYSPSLQTE